MSDICYFKEIYFYLFLREQVLEMFHHAYWSYMVSLTNRTVYRRHKCAIFFKPCQKYAYPADELMPLSCQGRYRGVTPCRGDVDDALGK